MDEYERPGVTLSKSSSFDCEIAYEGVARPTVKPSTYLLLFGVLYVVFHGSHLYTAEAQRDYLLTATDIRCVSGVTIQRSRGKHATLHFNDAEGKVLAYCSPRCDYKNWRADIGKTATICLSDDVVVSIETEEGVKVNRESLIHSIDHSIWWDKLMMSLGFVALAIFAFIRRKKWTATLGIVLVK